MEIKAILNKLLSNIKRFLKVILAATILSFFISVILSIIYYTPLSARKLNIYYFSFGESLFWNMLYLLPFIIIIGIISTLVYTLLGKTVNYSNKIKIGISLFIAIVSIISLYYVLNHTNSEVTNDIYLIPQEYEGQVFVFYNIKGAPEVQTEDGFEVHFINDQGYFVTSTPEFDVGLVTDKYYYVDKEGNRTQISNNCVSSFGTAGFQTTEGNKEIDIKYTGFNLTKEKCSEDFMVGNSMSFERKDEIINEILKVYYNIVQ
ncbi:DUF6843 domain-containing protein [Bacillus pinisoli]|uniref:DUF6843 domain-containing protein n=1 Tax=Bacillus pinisoli TaxID=2901866 RepID=UPI001FF3270D|nr:hypothetical protein [Bacillus pinisoli]